MHCSDKIIEEAYIKEKAKGDLAYEQLCAVKHQCVTNCQALVLHPHLLTLRNGQVEVFGRPSITKSVSKQIRQSVAVLFSSATLFTLNRFDFQHFMLECHNDAIKLVETQSINEAVLLKLERHKKYLLHRGDQLIMAGSYNPDRQFESYVEITVEELVVPEKGKKEEEDEEESKESGAIDLRPWVSDVNVLYEGDPCTLEATVKRVKCKKVVSEESFELLGSGDDELDIEGPEMSLNEQVQCKTTEVGSD